MLLELRMMQGAVHAEALQSVYCFVIFSELRLR